MKFHDKYYVGFQKDRYFNTDEQRMLGFATPMESNKAFEKRKETVDSWRDNEISPIELDNKPRYGFKIVDTVSRYSTSNKFFRVLDPEGFELEISTENLFQIINDCGIIKGTITDAMVWAQTKPYLVSVNSDEYKEHLAPTKNATHTPGKWMKHRVGNVFYRYEGKFPFVEVIMNVERINKAAPPTRYGYYNRMSRDPDIHTRVSTMIKSKKEKITVYTEWQLDEDGSILKTPTIHLRKSYFKDMIELTNDDLKKVPEYVLPKHELITEGLQRTDRSYGYGYRYGIILCDTKDELSNYKFTQEELEKAFRPYDVYDPNTFHDPIRGKYRENREYFGTITTSIRYVNEYEELDK